MQGLKTNVVSEVPRRVERLDGSSGFSLVEALVVVFVVGLTTLAAAPSFTTQLSKLRLESTATDIANLMRQTRLRAIRDNAEYSVSVSGTEIVGMGAVGNAQVELSLEAPVVVYQPGDGDADCLDKYDGAGGAFDDDSLIFQGNGCATGTGAICVHDGRGNVLQVVLEFTTSQPKIRKYLAAEVSPTTEAGFFEKTSYSAEAGTSNAWVWF